jgi:hypothetical protein
MFDWTPSSPHVVFAKVIPYCHLFLFVADGLSKLIQHQVAKGELRELHVCRRAPSISHLLFADDTLLFMEANRSQTEVINKILRCYELNTAQLINPMKCSIMFDARCHSYNKKDV